ncbi:sugar ABC transporter permease [Aquibium carbonis]|uniref:Sugar ABC transporter permease n=1 Tax=Aquibium carbonis TaxID=2495581 RepID=A0A429YZH9_9HYPH|nr:sugar ABC transporter permease [Aquibium carbonis]RST86875.1 sugar ABC transporter permease [Aquibium carbonis]
MSADVALSTRLGRAKRLRRLAEAATGWGLALPAAVLMLALILIPTASAALLALTDYQLGARRVSFIGAANFVEMWRDRVFWQAFANTLIYTALTVPLSVGLGLGAALLIEADPTGRTAFRTIYFLPVTALLVAMATVWEFILHPQLGLVNVALRQIGIAGPDWLASPDWVLASLGFIFVWQQTGYNMILFLAGLKGISPELYQAARVDGADRGVERFTMVTWPGLAATTLFVTVITTLYSFRVFDTVAALTQGGPSNASNVLLYNIYREGFVYLRTGYASAMTLVFLALILMVAMVQMRARRGHSA